EKWIPLYTCFSIDCFYVRSKDRNRSSALITHRKGVSCSQRMVKDRSESGHSPHLASYTDMRLLHSKQLNFIHDVCHPILPMRLASLGLLNPNNEDN
ncbi:hypothetical protein COCMIDRAFT_108624, partial [Bipolaris oryzae ATCC 44560]